jgi:iron uptake system EfeUOB component EfeO/EfeM
MDIPEIINNSNKNVDNVNVNMDNINIDNVNANVNMDNVNANVKIKKYKYWKWSTGETNVEKSIRNEKAKFTRMTLNKKEMCLNTMCNRELIKHNITNPFMVNNNYLDDITNQEKFLKPKNSNFEPRSRNE